jgi:DNA-binding LacI/PurR family transcriptional regulator
MILSEIIENSKNSKSNRKRANADGIYDVLKEYIESYSSHNYKFPPISELTRQFGANYRTVKAALSKLEENGLIVYESNTGSVVNQKHILLYVRWEGNAFNAALADGVRRYCTCQENIDLVFIDANKCHQRVIDGIHAMADAVDGVLLMPFEIDAYYDIVNDLQNQNKVVVQIDRVLPDLDISSVTCDDFGGGYQATSHLLHEHNRPVYFFGNSSTPSSSRNRHSGWEEAMKEHGFFDVEKYCVDLDVTEKDELITKDAGVTAEINAVKKLFDSHPEKKYSIFASNDLFACTICRIAEQKGLRVGKDVFIVGFGDMPLCKNLDVTLSSVDQAAEKVGYEAAKLLHNQLNSKTTRQVHQVLPVKLEVRQSSVKEL